MAKKKAAVKTKGTKKKGGKNHFGMGCNKK